MFKIGTSEEYCGNEMVKRRGAVLPDALARLVGEAQEFLNLEFEVYQHHSWFRRCMELRETRDYLKNKHQTAGGFFAKSLAMTAAKAYSAISFSGNESRFLTVQKARQIQNKAIGLNGLIAGELLRKILR